MMKQRSKQNLSKYKKFDKGSGGSSDEEMELFLKNKQPRKEIPTIDITVKEEDTLQSLAIRYHCTIEDLKRLNNIHRDNEIFAKNTIRIPQRPFTTALAPVHQSGTNSPIQNHPLSVPNQNLDLNAISSRLNNKDADKELNEIIFNSNIQQKSCDNKSYEEEAETAEEVHLLPQDQLLPPVAETITSRLHCSGVDGDISVLALILCIVIVVLLGPVIYVFYIAEHPPQHPHHQL